MMVQALPSLVVGPVSQASEVLTGSQVDWIMGGNFLNVNVTL